MCCLYRLHNGEQDEVAAGAARNNVLQRMKLNNKVALITGEALPLSSPYSPHLLVQADLHPGQPLCACRDAFSTSASLAVNASPSCSRLEVHAKHCLPDISGDTSVARGSGNHS